MNIARAVRQIHKKRPYPALRTSAEARGQWLLPPLPWIKAIWQRQQPIRRILVTGCGTGNEAFALRHQFQDSFPAGAGNNKENNAGIDLSMASAMKRHVRFVYEQANQNQRRTAKLLGISRSTVARYLRDVAKK